MTLCVKVENPVEELQSFPLNQSITLSTNEVVEDAFIQQHITLLRNVTDVGPLNNADMYNYNIGFVKEKFSTVPIKIDIKGTTITVSPLETLNPGSSYTLFLDKGMSSEHTELVKTYSISNSSLELIGDVLRPVEETDDVYALEIVSKPLITSKSNIVKLKLYVNGMPDKTFTVDAKSSKNTISFKGYTVRVLDTAYGEGEKFELVVEKEKARLSENLIVPIRTVLNEEIKPADIASISHTLTHQDILDFYQGIDEESKEVEIKAEDIQNDITLEYVGYNKVLLHLNKLKAENLDFDNMTSIEFPAYNRYDLECLQLYDECEYFYIEYKLLDEKTILMEFKKGAS